MNNSRVAILKKLLLLGAAVTLSSYAADYAYLREQTISTTKCEIVNRSVSDVKISNVNGENYDGPRIETITIKIGNASEFELNGSRLTVRGKDVGCSISQYSRSGYTTKDCFSVISFGFEKVSGRQIKELKLAEETFKKGSCVESAYNEKARNERDQVVRRAQPKQQVGHGGVNGVYRFEDGKAVQVKCNDGTKEMISKMETGGWWFSGRNYDAEYIAAEAVCR